MVTVAPGASVGVLVCVPDSSVSVSSPSCPASPVASLQVVPGVVLTSSDYQNLLSYAGPIDQAEGYQLSMTCAGTVIACYLLSLGVGTVLRMIRSA